MAVFNKQLKLLRITPGAGNKPGEIKASTIVWAEIKDIGTTTKLAAKAADTKVDIQATMWRREFHDYTHAEVAGVRYKVQESGSTQNKLHIKLTLSKGN